MTFEERLSAILAEDVPACSETPVVVEPEELPAPKTFVTIAALGGRPRVDVDESALKKLTEAAGVSVQGDLAPLDFGRLVEQAKRARSTLLGSLLNVRATTSLYRVTSEGRSWWSIPRPVAPEVTIAQEVCPQPVLTQEVQP